MSHLREELATGLLAAAERWVRVHPQQVLLLEQDYRGTTIFVAARAIVRIVERKRKKQQSLGVVWDTKDCSAVFRNNRPYERAWAMLESMLWYGPVQVRCEPLPQYLGQYKQHFVE